MNAEFFLSLLILGLLATALAKGGHRHPDDDHDDDDDDHYEDDDHHEGNDRHHHRKPGDSNHDDGKCPQPITPPELPTMKCTVTDGCKTFSCSAEIEGETVTLNLEIDVSQKPLSAEVTLWVPRLGYEWSHSFKSEEKIQVPTFPPLIQELMGADMYLMFTTFKGKWGVGFKLDMFLTTGASTDAMHVQLLKSKMPYKGNDYPEPYQHHRWNKCHKFASWFKRQSAPVKAAIIISIIFVSMVLIFGLARCCKKRNANKLKVSPPSYDEATPPKTVLTPEPSPPSYNEATPTKTVVTPEPSPPSYDEATATETKVPLE